MKSSRFVKLLMLMAVSGVLLALCVGGAVTFWLVARAVSGAGTARGGSVSSRIAVVGNDGNLWLATPDGAEIRHATTDGKGYRFPAWSPDSRRLAFIGPSEEGNTALFTYDSSTGDTAVLFNSSEAAPFYIYWSPDSHSVTFLTQERSGLAMRLADAEEPGLQRVLAEGAPFYWAWSPDGDQLFMHVGGSRALSEDAHLSLLENEEGAHRIELKLAPGRFQAPLWSASGRFIYYIAADENAAEAIYRTDMDTSVQTLVVSLSSSAFMILSPDDRHIAYLELQTAGQLPGLGAAHIVATDGTNKREVLSSWVAAMYWSPDGKKLALLTAAQGGQDPTARAPGLAAPSSQPEGLRWWIYDVETDTLDLLTSFAPTLDFLQTVPYFDQYHLSLTFWSPDSRYIVVTKREAGSQNGTIWVFDVTGEKAPRQIGAGSFAVWSWR